jgi:hypothetical protein
MQDAVSYFSGGANWGSSSVGIGSTHAMRRTTEAAEDAPPWKVALWERSSVEAAMLRVPIVILTLLGLWGCNVFIMDRMRIQYNGVLSLGSLSVRNILMTAAVGIILYFTMIILTVALALSPEIGMLCYYLLVTILAFIPSLAGHDGRISLMRLTKTVHFPGDTIAFSEVLLADAFTSLSKVYKDIGVTAVACYADLQGVRLIDLHSYAIIIIAVLASLPYWLRVRQCSVQFESLTDPWSKFPVALNIVKYMSAFPPIWLAAMASLGYFHDALPSLTATMAAINSTYSFLWDVIMDWGIITFHRTGRVHMRQRAFYPIVAYILAIVFNLLLRFSWAAHSVPTLAKLPATQLVLIVEVAEVVRRAVWFFFRIEWEIISKQEKIDKQRSSISLTATSHEGTTEASLSNEESSGLLQKS